MLGAHIFVAEAPGFGLGMLEQLADRRREDGLPPAGHLGKGAQALFEELFDSIDGNPGGFEDREDGSVLLLQQGLENVLGSDFGVTGALGGLLRGGEGLLALRGQAIESHGLSCARSGGSAAAQPRSSYRRPSAP